MTRPTIDQFDRFFRSLHGHSPFPWQSMLLQRVATEGWPDLIDLPTASGKTACIDVAVFALAMGLPTPRRIWFVVDRRIVVDEAYARAVKVSTALRYAHAPAPEREALRCHPDLAPVLASVASPDCPAVRAVASALCEGGGTQPLEVGRLRGGAPRAIRWAGNPVQPAVLTSTIDQLGSRLLFRGYGVSDYAKPIHAALAGNDSLIILDEAHLAKPFLETVAAVQRFRCPPWAEQEPATPLKLVVMSATPPEALREGRMFPAAAERAAALDHPLLRQRAAVPKPAELVLAARPKLGKGKRSLGEPVCEDELVLDAAGRAIEFADAGRRRIAVMVNRVRTARRIVQQLRRACVDEAQAPHIELMTGRLRPLDRDELVERLAPVLRSGSREEPARPIILVTTQCLEVGADFSFDALISECASLDALRQRFGRLARLGEPENASGVILMRRSDVAAKAPDPVYGNALAKTWKWLNENADGSSGAKVIGMGIDALARVLPEDLSPLRTPETQAPVLLPAYVDLWSQTSPRPAVDPDVALFLHGVPPPDERPRMQVRVLWRNELTILPQDRWSDAIRATPPLSAEMLTVPVRELREALTGPAVDEEDDLEGRFETEPNADDHGQMVRVFVWRGREHAELRRLDELRPDDVVVLPGHDASFVKLLPSAILPADVYDLAFAVARGTAIIRHPASLGCSAAMIELDEEEDPRATLLASARAALSSSADGRYRRSMLESIARLEGPSTTGPVGYVKGHACWLVIGSHQPEPVDAWESDIEDQELLRGAGERRLLQVHTQRVLRAALHLARTLPPDQRSAVAHAARLHDLGKADCRFQAYLAGRSRPAAGPLLAKSDRNRTPWQDHELRRLLRLPDGFRHEMLSALLAEGDASVAPELRELVLHLIAAHHGRARPFAPVVDDADPPSVTVESLMCSAQQRRDRPAHRLDSGVAERFWTLTRKYGWWGLAYFEAVLRCADIHASAYDEQEAP